MPQFDIYTFLPQLLWLFITFFIFHFTILQVYLPSIASILKARNKASRKNIGQNSIIYSNNNVNISKNVWVLFNTIEQTKNTLNESYLKLIIAQLESITTQVLFSFRWTKKLAFIANIGPMIYRKEGVSKIQANVTKAKKATKTKKTTKTTKKKKV